MELLDAFLLRFGEDIFRLGIALSLIHIWKIIVDELEQVRKKYAVPRRTEIVYGHEVEEYVEDSQPEEMCIRDRPEPAAPR